MNDLKRQGIKAFVWDFFGKMITHGMGFIVSIFLARLLEPSDFGMVAMIMVIIGMASVLTDAGLATALIQRRKVQMLHYSSVFYFNIFIATLIAFIIFFSASEIGDFYGNEELIPLVQAMSILFIINAFSSVQSVQLRKQLKFSLLTKITMFSSLFSGILGVILAFSGAGVWSLVVQSLSMGLMYNILIWTISDWTPSLRFSLKALLQLWSFGFRMFLSGILDAVFTRLDFLIIGKLFPVATLGYFQRAKSLNSMVVQYSSSSLVAVLFPVLSKVQKDLPRFQNIVIKGLGIISFIVFLLLGGLYMVSEELIILLFSEKWRPSVDIFKILVLSGFAYPLSALLVNVLSSRGNSKAFLRLDIYKRVLASFTFVVLYFLGIEIFLYYLVFNAFLAVFLNILFVSKEIQLPSKFFIKPIIVQAAISTVTVLMTQKILLDIESINMYILFLKGLIFLAIYLAINYLFKTSSYTLFIEQFAFILKNRFGKG